MGRVDLELSFTGGCLRCLTRKSLHEMTTPFCSHCKAPLMNRYILKQMQQLPLWKLRQRFTKNRKLRPSRRRKGERGLTLTQHNVFKIFRLEFLIFTQRERKGLKKRYMHRDFHLLKVPYTCRSMLASRQPALTSIRCSSPSRSNVRFGSIRFDTELN